MALKRYDLVNTKGLKGIDYKGQFIPFDAITDEMADELVSKTHVLKLKEGQEPTTAELAVLAPVAAAEPAAEEAPATTRPRRNS